MNGRAGGLSTDSRYKPVREIHISSLTTQTLSVSAYVNKSFLNSNRNVKSTLLIFNCKGNTFYLWNICHIKHKTLKSVSFPDHNKRRRGYKVKLLFSLKQMDLYIELQFTLP